MRYSLATYILAIEPNDPTLKSVYGTMTIGGEGSAIGSISFSRNDDQFSVKGYPTGGYVVSKNLSKIGQISLQINQFSNQVNNLIDLAEAFFENDYDGFTITLSTNNGELVASAKDAFIARVPEQTFSDTASDQTWNFVCGEITYR